MSETAIKRPLTRQPGISLVEMVVGLMIFSIIIFPLAVLPMKAVEQTGQAQSGTIAAFEIRRFFDDFSQEVGRSHRFMSVKPIATGAQLNMNESQQVFMAYWDEKTKSVKRVGYTFRQITPQAGAQTDTASAGLRRWQLLRAEIAPDAVIQDFEINDPIWKPMGKVTNDSNFYITGNKLNTDPIFVYCRASVCNPSIPAAEADGVRIQSSVTSTTTVGNSSAGSISFVYRQSRTPLRPLYFKLASLQQHTNREFAEIQVAPFSMALSRWDVTNSWIAEKTKLNTAIGNYKVPVETDKSGELNAATQLPLNDMHYNYRTGEMLVVTNSPNTSTTDAGLYIFKFMPGLPDYQPYSLSVSSGGSYTDNFPVALHVGDPGWPQGVSPRFLSVTQDIEENIYVLTRTGDGGSNAYRFWIQKFSPEGAWVSRFNLGTDISNVANGVIGLAYNPSSPNEVLALLRTSSGRYVIRAYPKDLNEDDPARAVPSAESPNLNVIDVTPDDFVWSLAKGLEYDPLHNRFIIIFGDAQSARVLSLDIDIRTGTSKSDEGTPAERAQAIHTLYPPNKSVPLTNPFGVAYDPLNNHVFVTTGENNTYPYYRILPNVRLNLVHK